MKKFKVILDFRGAQDGVTVTDFKAGEIRHGHAVLRAAEVKNDFELLHPVSFGPRCCCAIGAE